jgi:hypothetical protein
LVLLIPDTLVVEVFDDKRFWRYPTGEETKSRIWRREKPVPWFNGHDARRCKQGVSTPEEDEPDDLLD